MRPDRQHHASLTSIWHYTATAPDHAEAWRIADHEEHAIGDVCCVSHVDCEESRTAALFVFPLDCFPTLCRYELWKHLLEGTLSEPDARHIFETVERVASEYSYVHRDSFWVSDDFPFFPERPQ